MKKYETIRDITKKECSWLREDIKRGTIVYKAPNNFFLLSVCTDKGVMVSMDGNFPFIEIPANSIEILLR